MCRHVIGSLGCAQDTVDLRANHWIARRKVEGPKTIEEIHKEARAELMRQRSSGPPPDRGRRPPPPDARSMPSCSLLTAWALIRLTRLRVPHSWSSHFIQCGGLETEYTFM